MKKMRCTVRMMIVFIIASLMLYSCASSDPASLSVTPHAVFAPTKAVDKLGGITEEVRGVWIASVYNINFPSSPDLSSTELKVELDTIVENALKCNLNTIYFQVHPASDALYRSDIFPVSKYLFTDGILHFDPLEYMVDICKENGISLYAWVNPLRVSVSATDSEEEARDSLPKGSPGKDSELTVFYGDGKLYLNCGEAAVRQLVADAVEEIVTSYDVDGVVFDDYFYPYPVSDPSGQVYIFNDNHSYNKAETSLTIANWRRSNVNDMIKLCYDKIKAYDPNVIFGVAPFGIWQNNDGTNGGSDTSGMEAYSELYCDASAWVKGQYVDFISPQLYWKCDSTSAPFGELMSFWNRITDGTGVDLIISHGIFQYEAWDDPEGELLRQIELARNCVSYKGSMLYGYANLIENTSGIADETFSAFEKEVYYYHRAEYPQSIIVSIENTSIYNDRIIFEGHSDLDNMLTVNGTTLNRTHSGYFKCELALKQGVNEFAFKCGNTVKTITVINAESTK